MAKRVEKVFKVLAPGGKATPAPPLGPVLGANGVNPGQFIQLFNDRTKELNGKIVGCIVTLYADRSFDLEIKSSPAAELLKLAAGVPKGSGVPHTDKVGSVSKDQVKSIAEEKWKISTQLALSPQCALSKAQQDPWVSLWRERNNAKTNKKLQSVRRTC